MNPGRIGRNRHSRRRPVVSAPVRPSDVPAAPPAIPGAGTGTLAVFSCIALVVVLCLNMGWSTAGWSVFGLAVLWAAGGGTAKRSAPGIWLFAATFTGILLMTYGLSALGGMRAYLSHPLPFTAARSFPFLAGGFVLLLGVFRWMRREIPGPDHPWRTRLIFFVILGAGLTLRLIPLDVPSPCWSEDFTLNLTYARRSLDFRDFRPLIYPYGARQPFFPYLLVLAYGIFPTASSLLILKGACALVDGAAIWIHYLLGKEIGGRRAGWILAAALALSKPAVLNCVSSQTPVTVPLAMGLILLFAFRFLRKSDVRHALYWAGALAFGAYCYTSVRPVLWWIPVAVSTWILLGPRRADMRRFVLQGLGILVVWSYAYLSVNRFLPGSIHSNVPLRIMMILLAVLLVVWGMGRLRDPNGPSECKKAGVLVLGLFTAVLLALPMLVNPLWAPHTVDNSIIGNPGNSSFIPGGFNSAFWLKKFEAAFQSFFFVFYDRPDMGLPGEAFFSIHSAPLILSGLAWALVHRGRTAIILLGCIATGMVVHLLALGSHTGRFMGVVTPVLLLGALSWDALLRSAEARGRWMKAAGLGLVLFWGVWSFEGLYYRFFTCLFGHTGNIPVTAQVFRRHLPNYRVYFVPSIHLTTPDIFDPLVDDLGDLLLFNPEGNEVPRYSDGRVPDVMVCFSTADTELRDRLVREFPRGRMVLYRSSGLIPPQEPPYLYQFYLKGRDVPVDPKSILRAVQVPEGAWSRRYYAYQFGLGHGIMEREEWVMDPLSPTPKARAYQVIAMKGEVRIPRDGYCRFTVEGKNYAVLELDGRRVLDYRPTATRPGRNLRYSHLKAGKYQAILRTYIEGEVSPPPVKVLFPGKDEARPLGAS